MSNNPVEKGNKFEDRVYQLIKELLENDELPISKKRSKVYQKKGYYSKMREDNIIFDISIETYLPNQDKYSMLWLIECKDYEQAIPVNRIQTFKTQIDEVAGHKGIFISSNKYQKGAINTARSYGIGLAIMQKDNNLQWKVQRKESKFASIDENDLEAIFTDDKIAHNDFIITAKNNRIFDNIIDYFQFEGILIKPKTDFKVPYLEIIKIENIALDCFGKQGLREFFRIKTEEIIEFIETKLGFTIVTNDDLLNNELGKLDLKQKKLYITNKLEFNSPRWRFTLAHELGHIVLHKSILTNNGHFVTTEEDLSDPLLLNARIMSKPNLKRLEYQANLFASYVLLPNYPMGLKLSNIMQRLNIEFTSYRRHLYYDDNPRNKDLCNKTFAYVAKSFDVSISVVKYRLIELNLLIDNSHSKSIYGIYKDFVHE